MSYWMTARKGSTLLHLDYASTFSNNVFGHNTRIRAEPDFEIRIDLNPNLRVRNKDTGTFLDARDLADGRMSKLTLLQLDDARIINMALRCLKKKDVRPKIWRLTLELEQEWCFEVRPEIKRSHMLQSLFLHVAGPCEEGT
jgi:hypothetical protein